MYGMLQPVFCNALYSVLRRFVQWRFARPRYICKVLMKNRENMEEKSNIIFPFSSQLCSYSNE